MIFSKTRPGWKLQRRIFIAEKFALASSVYIMNSWHIFRINALLPLPPSRNWITSLWAKDKVQFSPKKRIHLFWMEVGSIPSLNLPTRSSTSPSRGSNVCRIIRLPSLIHFLISRWQVKLLRVDGCCWKNRSTARCGGFQTLLSKFIISWIIVIGWEKLASFTIMSR